MAAGGRSSSHPVTYVTTACFPSGLTCLGPLTESPGPAAVLLPLGALFPLPDKEGRLNPAGNSKEAEWGVSWDTGGMPS